MGRRPTPSPWAEPDLGRSAGRTDGLWAGVPILKPPVPPLPRPWAVLSLGSLSARGAVPVAEPVVFALYPPRCTGTVLPPGSDAHLPGRVQRTLSTPLPLVWRCSIEGSRGSLSPVASSSPSSWENSAPRLLGCWLHPSRGPLTRPLGISSPSRGDKKTNFCNPCLVSPTGRVSEFRRDLRASHPGTWADILCPETPP